MTTIISRFSRRFAFVVVVGAAFSAPQAHASAIIFDNTTAMTGTLGGYQIAPDNSYEISSLFIKTTAGTDAIQGVTFDTYGGDSVLQVNWAISCCAYGNQANSIFESGTATTTDVNLGDGVNFDYFSIGSIGIPSGGYFLTLWDAVGVNGGNVYWDESKGPSSNAQVGQYFGGSPSGPTVTGQSLTFQILDTSTPTSIPPPFAPESSTGLYAGLVLAAWSIYSPLRRRSALRRS